jgi:hypothetical protein
MIILHTGPTGVGKTDAGWPHGTGAACGVLDCDWFAAREPFLWKLERDVESVYQALSVMADYHTTREASRFVIPLDIIAGADQRAQQAL